MTLQIDNYGGIHIDNKDTGLKVRQAKINTIVYSPATTAGALFKEHKMPEPRYSLSHTTPASGVAGIDKFEADILKLLTTS